VRGLAAVAQWPRSRGTGGVQQPGGAQSQAGVAGRRRGRQEVHDRDRSPTSRRVTLLGQDPGRWPRTAAAKVERRLKYSNTRTAPSSHARTERHRQQGGRPRGDPVERGRGHPGARRRPRTPDPVVVVQPGLRPVQAGRPPRCTSARTGPRRQTVGQRHLLRGRGSGKTLCVIQAQARSHSRPAAPASEDRPEHGEPAGQRRDLPRCGDHRLQAAAGQVVTSVVTSGRRSRWPHCRPSRPAAAKPRSSRST